MLVPGPRPPGEGWRGQGLCGAVVETAPLVSTFGWQGAQLPPGLITCLLQVSLQKFLVGWWVGMG